MGGLFPVALVSFAFVFWCGFGALSPAHFGPFPKPLSYYLSSRTDSVPSGYACFDNQRFWPEPKASLDNLWTTGHWVHSLYRRSSPKLRSWRRTAAADAVAAV